MINRLVYLVVVSAIFANILCVQFPEKREDVSDEVDKVEKEPETRESRALGVDGFTGGILDHSYTNRGRGRRPNFPMQISHPSRDYELLMNLLVRNNSQWESAALAAGDGDPRRFQDRLTAMLGESK